MIPGFNHNIRYRGRIFHCQTEDSGIANPHIITHLFVGGNILATKKTSYADIVKADHLEEVVTELMKDQHKEFIKRLISGTFDQSIEARGAGAKSLDGPAPLNVESGGQMRESFGMGGGTKPAGAPKTVAPAPIAAPRPIAAPQPLAAQKAGVAAKVSAAVKAGVPSEPVAIIEPARRPQEVVDASLLMKAPPPKPTPAATGTIFGEDLISEKSLDEVILSYLADETNR